jgi:hypothetical protein
MFPFEKYKYYVDEENKTVVAIQTFAKKKYRGIAKCSGEDTFDIEKGKKLAALKCNLKIATARYEYANKKISMLNEMMDIINTYEKSVNDYFKWAVDNLEEANSELIKFVDDEL